MLTTKFLTLPCTLINVVAKKKSKISISKNHIQRKRPNWIFFLVPLCLQLISNLWVHFSLLMCVHDALHSPFTLNYVRALFFYWEKIEMFGMWMALIERRNWGGWIVFFVHTYLWIVCREKGVEKSFFYLFSLLIKILFYCALFLTMGNVFNAKKVSLIAS